MSQSRFARAVGALAAFAVCPGVLAEEPQRIEEVVVTGAREATPLAATPAAIGRLETRALDDAKATRIDQVINALPGVHMVDLGNEQHSMSIRQPITTNAVYQYLEDGVPIRPVGVFNHNALNEVNLTGAGEVEVIRGPASSLYGSNAVGGAVNFLTRARRRPPKAGWRCWPAAKATTAWTPAPATPGAISGCGWPTTARASAARGAATTTWTRTR